MSFDMNARLARVLTATTIWGLACVNAVASDLLPAVQMEQLIIDWPPTGWQLNPPLSSAPFPPILQDGLFSTTFYRVNDTASDSWSGSIKIADKITKLEAEETLDQYPFCDPVTYMGLQAKECGAMGEQLGRREIVYPLGRLFVEISIMGPKPIEVPEIEIRAPQ